MNLFLTDKPVPFSLSHLNSDFLDNAVILEQVVGTLVKYGNSGSYEPFLAEKWQISPDELKWTFFLRPNLMADDGIQINAPAFVKSFKHILKIYGGEYSPPTFDQLVGWKEFAAGDNNALAVKATADNSIVFEFAKRPSGLLEFLAMPYYGYYSFSDFDGDRWRDKHKITASGAYRVVEISDFQAKLQARKEWPFHGAKSPKSVTVSYESPNDAVKLSQTNPACLISIRGETAEPQNQLATIEGTPTVLTSLVLSPWLEPFRDKNVREAFRTVIRDITTNEIKNSKLLSNFFYPNFSAFPLRTMEYPKALEILKNAPNKIVSTFVSKLTSESNTALVGQILNVFSQRTGWSFTKATPDSIGADWFKRARTNKEFALRVARVDIGGSAENWVINMMFCSNLGISFPDPDGAVCKLVQNFESGAIQNRERYQVALHDVIENESVVVPLMHTGFSWLVGRGLSASKIPQTMNIPRFDLLELVL